ncbi:MAG: helix-turn-helix domain-containing protein [Candidatus Altiarchaeota archaeon]
MDENSVMRLGLPLSQAKVYLALLRLGQTQAGRIAKKAQVNRTTTYDAIEGLIEKGLVSYVIVSSRRVFQATAPRRFLEIIKQQEQAAKDILPELETIHSQSKEKEEAQVYKGRKGIRAILNDILNCKEYVAFGSSGRFLEIMDHNFHQFQMAKRKKKIRAKVILQESARQSESVAIAYTTFRFIPDSYAAPTTTFIYANKTATITWSEIPVATVIEGADVAKSFKNYFALLWENAEK